MNRVQKPSIYAAQLDALPEDGTWVVVKLLSRSYNALNQAAKVRDIQIRTRSGVIWAAKNRTALCMPPDTHHGRSKQASRAAVE